MAASKVDQIVKGAPAPDVSVQDIAAAAGVHTGASGRAKQEAEELKKPGSHGPAQDPLALLPSSPPQIYLNLLILEASLRSQYLALRARRRLHNFVITALTLWIALFTYLLFYRPREDGKGAGGSPYWVIDVAEKIGWMVGLLTLFLMWATGQIERGVRWPRRWVSVTNRGLRGMNLKVVIMKGPWWQRLISYPALFFPLSSISSSQGSSYHYLELPEKHKTPTSRFVYRDGHQFPGVRIEDTAPGGDVLKVLLLSKPFSPEFRENWDIYRTEYWEKENERRAELRRILHRRHRDSSKQMGGWRWWTGTWRFTTTSKVTRDLEKMPASAQHSRNTSSVRRRRESLAQGTSHSRSSSRSSTAEPDDGRSGLKPFTRQTRSSISGTTRSKRASKTWAADEAQNLSKRASMISNASSSSGDESSHAGTGGGGPNVRTRQRDLSMTSGEA